MAKVLTPVRILCVLLLLVSIVYTHLSFVSTDASEDSRSPLKFEPSVSHSPKPPGTRASSIALQRSAEESKTPITAKAQTEGTQPGVINGDFEADTDTCACRHRGTRQAFTGGEDYCRCLKTAFDVAPGHAWGVLTDKCKTIWKDHSCDDYFRTPVEAAAQSSKKGYAGPQDVPNVRNMKKDDLMSDSGSGHCSCGHRATQMSFKPGGYGYCHCLMTMYGVVPDQTWGTLPQHCWKDWRDFSCDGEYLSPQPAGDKDFPEPTSTPAPALVSGTIEKDIEALFADAKKGGLRRCSDLDPTAYSRGKWVPFPEARLPKEWHQCEDAPPVAGGTVPAFLQWRWQPDQCDLLPTTVHGFCLGLRGRDLNFVGDSIMAAHFSAMRHNVFPERCADVATDCQICSEEYGPDHQLHFQIFRNNKLLDADGSDQNRQWRPFLRRKNVNMLRPVVVFTTGAHHHSTSAIETVHERMLPFFRDLRKLDPAQPVLYRTNAAGHPGCRAITQIMTKAVNYTELELRGETMAKKYTWDHFERWDKLFADNFTPIGTRVVDVWTMSVFRGDEHVAGPNNDCLHWCQESGTIQLWTQLIYNMLLGWV